MADIVSIREKITRARNKDITQRHLPVENFELCEKLKNGICDYLLLFLKHIEERKGVMSDEFFDHLVIRVEEQFKSVLGGIDDIFNFVQPGRAANSDIASFVNNITRHFRSFDYAIHSEFSPFMAWYEIKRMQKEQDSLVEIKQRWPELTTQFESKVSECSSALLKIRDELQLITNLKAAKNFQERSIEHGEHAKSWFIASIAGAVIVGILAIWSFWTIGKDIDPQAVTVAAGTNQPAVASNSGTTLLANIAGRLMLLSVFGIVLKVCVTKYTLERNLYVIYRHRNNVLDLYRTADAALDPEKQREAKDQLRLEIARLIYSDPETGMVKTAGEFNFAPVMSAVEKAGS